MITVNGTKSDYAIMKQVQQIMRSGPHQVVPLDEAGNYSSLGPQEKLYVVSHGNPETGRLRDVATASLTRYLTAEKYPLPKAFGGIVILSCYSGEKIRSFGKPLAAELAAALKGKVAAGTTVAGALGYSFGTTEFQKTGRSSVLSRTLASFYFLKDIPGMRKEWLAHRPTHTDGVLKSQFFIDVDVHKTIGENLQKANQDADNVAQTCVSKFTKEATDIQTKLGTIIARIPGDSVVARADYLTRNTDQQDVKDWNAAIGRQYELFQENYLWTPPKDAFFVDTVPADH